MQTLFKCLQAVVLLLARHPISRLLPQHAVCILHCNTAVVFWQLPNADIHDDRVPGLRSELGQVTEQYLYKTQFPAGPHVWLLCCCWGCAAAGELAAYQATCSGEYTGALQRLERSKALATADLKPSNFSGGTQVGALADAEAEAAVIRRAAMVQSSCVRVLSVADVHR